VVALLAVASVVFTEMVLVRSRTYSGCSNIEHPPECCHAFGCINTHSSENDVATAERRGSCCVNDTGGQGSDQCVNRAALELRAQFGLKEVFDVLGFPRTDADYFWLVKCVRVQHQLR